MPGVYQLLFMHSIGSNNINVQFTNETIIFNTNSGVIT